MNIGKFENTGDDAVTNTKIYFVLNNVNGVTGDVGEEVTTDLQATKSVETKNVMSEVTESDAKDNHFATLVRQKRSRVTMGPTIFCQMVRILTNGVVKRKNR